jgi:hypothetical protein
MAEPSWIQNTEKVVAENHATLADIANRTTKTLHANAIVDHDADGHHKGSADTILSGTPIIITVTDSAGTPYYFKAYPTKV